ncbi:MAG: sugar kinase, partial [Candidatus Omnitrophica bacterium]|nr:sugar kinase [Candidatus Omnitrophota bacterium]
MSILVVGSVALDTVKTPKGKVSRVLGGSASYFSVSAANFSKVSLVAVVGEDFDHSYIRLLKRRNINLNGLKKQEGKTFSWSGEYGEDFGDANTIATNLNVFADFKPFIPESLKKHPYLFLANIDPQLQLNVLQQVNQPKITACDTMNYWINTKQKYLVKLIKKVDIFFLNESEARLLTQKSNIVSAGKRILKMGPKVVLIKKGENGAILFSQKKTFVAPAFLLEKIVDPTGAGDTFAGGFMGHICKAKKLDFTCLRNAVL